MITRSWLVLRVTGDSPLALTIVTLAFALPMTVISPLGGALADRISTKKLIMYSQLANALLTLIIGILDFTGLINFWLIMLIGIFNGSLMAISMPSRQVIISDTVPDEKLMNAISLNHSSMNLTRILGPACAGFLILLFDTAGVIFIVAGTYLFSAATIAAMNHNSTQSKKTKPVSKDIKEGLQYSFRDPVLKGLFIMSFIPVLFGYSYYALLPAWAREALSINSDGLGILLMLMGIGATAGTLGLAAIGTISNRGKVMILSSVIWGASLAIFSQISVFWIAIPFLVLTGLASSLYMSLNMTMIQLNSSPEMRGRTMSIAMMTFGLMPLSAVPFGTIAEQIGTPDALSISGILLVIATIVYAARNRTFRQLQ